MNKFEGHNSVFEKQVLDAASNIPVEYNPKGWENLSKQLDMELPVNDVKMSARLKLWLISIGVSTLLVILLFSSSSFLELNSPTKTKETQIENGNKTYSEPTLRKQETGTLPGYRNLEDQLMNSNEAADDSKNGAFSFGEQSNQLLKNGLSKKKEEASMVTKDSADSIPQTKNEEDTLFIFW